MFEGLTPLKLHPGLTHALPLRGSGDITLAIFFGCAVVLFRPLFCYEIPKNSVTMMNKYRSTHR
jgi:hypothetical protein